MPLANLDHEHSGPAAECEICRHVHPFTMPDEIVDACAGGRLVVFAGAGVSTESRVVLQRTLYQEIARELGRPDDGLSFPELMGAFAEARGRRILLQRIVRRLEYVDAFPELSRAATRIHRKLASLFYVRDIVTTNWDPYFEQETGAIPLVTGEDYALWDLPRRKVFKIHGSILNLGSIVATTRDYERCYRALSRNILVVGQFGRAPAGALRSSPS